ncbi:MAG: hypothetical protein K2J63_00430, partial [Muribaculaceae bacterium]|nr:hypothetical protein [Muribaculaceae bacterium]
MKYLKLLILSLFTIFTVSAKSTHIIGEIYDKTTRTELPGAKVEVRHAGDTAVISKFDATMTVIIRNVPTEKARFHQQIDTDNRDLELTITCDNHDTEVITIPSGDLKGVECNLGIIYLTRSARQLEEVTVTTSKVKFYHKGDTLVYNADAFLLAEGSMLDALIRQLPGVEFRSDGQIFVNGEFVDNLLLNGKDF